MADIKVEYDSHMGDCLKVCRMAKDSFGRTTDWVNKCIYSYDSGVPDGFVHLGGSDEEFGICGELSKRDQRLLKMLARGMGEKEYNSSLDRISAYAQSLNFDAMEREVWKFRNTTPHLAPFGHNFITFKFQAPVFVMRQIVKHEYIRISELSMRYVRGMPEYFRPKSWRSVADHVKQGSGGLHDDQDLFDDWVNEVEQKDGELYDHALLERLAPEQARMFLRLCHMTQGHLSGSMDAIAGLVTKRIDSHAQEETREFARQVERKCREIWPYSWPALMEGVDVNA